jgi:LPXTG-motif cell wall-anchored protein
MRRALSTGLATAALLNLWAATAGPLAQEPAAQGGRAAAVTEAGSTPQPEPQPPVQPQERSNDTHAAVKVKAAGAGSVSIKDFSFGPSSITVHVGDTVSWSNTGASEHTATASNGSFDTGILKKGQSGSHTFNTAGTFSYICSVHPFMKGTVVVEAAAGSSTGSTSSSTPKAAGTAATPEAGTPGTTTPTQTGGLPNTGVDVWWLVLSGALLVASGLVLRRSAGSGRGSSNA